MHAGSSAEPMEDGLDMFSDSFLFKVFQDGGYYKPFSETER